MKSQVFAALATLTFVGSLLVSPQHSLAQDASEFQDAQTLDSDSFAMDIPADELSSSDSTHNLWWPTYRPGRPRPRPSRGVQCRAYNERGIVFYGQGRNVPEARDAALSRCYRVSYNCSMAGCEVLR